MKTLTISGFIALILFLILLFSYDSEWVQRIDSAMSNRFAGNGRIEFFRHFGETWVTMVVCTVLVIFFAYRRNYRRVLFSAYAISGGYFLNQLIKRIVKRERPAIPDQFSTFSFPSGHAMVGILYIFTLAFFISTSTTSKLVKWITWLLAIPFTFFVGMSRVAGERHFTSDIVAGWALGFACFAFLVGWYRNKAQEEK